MTRQIFMILIYVLAAAICLTGCGEEGVSSGVQLPVDSWDSACLYAASLAQWTQIP